MLSACSVSKRGATTSAEPTTTPHATTAEPTPPARTALPTVKRWRPNSGDVEPGVKRVAVAHIEDRGNQPGRALQVIDAQYGGLLADSASVLVVCRQWWRPAGGTVRTGGSTFDVRLVRRGSHWRVTAVHPSHPGPQTATMTPRARAVLASNRIGLPPASEADVGSGRVHDSVLAAMLTLSHTYRIGVSVVRSGHPLYVFGTDRLSDHPPGRAFDTWEIDGRLVVDPATSRTLVTGYMQAAAAAGSYNVGGPYLLGAAPQYFSDATHHDHVHAGFTT